jgi:hypothetical protein
MFIVSHPSFLIVVVIYLTSSKIKFDVCPPHQRFCVHPKVQQENEINNI